MGAECKGGIVSTIFKIQQIFGYKFFRLQVPMSHKDEWVLPNFPAIYISYFSNFIWALPKYPYILNGNPQTPVCALLINPSYATGTKHVSVESPAFLVAASVTLGVHAKM
jgi:hypothetical protein